MTPIRLAEGKYQTGKDEQKCISKPKEPSEVSKNNEEKLQLNKANRKIPQKTQLQKHQKLSSDTEAYPESSETTKQN